MNVFHTPEFIASHAERGGSPFQCLLPSQQAALSSALHLGVSSIPSHPGFHENDFRTDDEVKRLNDLITELVNLAVRPPFSFLFFTNFCLLFRSLLVFPAPCFIRVFLGILPSVNSSANIIFPVPTLALETCPEIPWSHYSAF